MGIPQRHVGHLSDIPYMLNLDVAGGGDNSPAQQKLSSLVSGSAAAFAYTGDPTNSQAQVLQNWPTAWSGLSAEAMKDEFPAQMDIYVIGGPHGEGVAQITKGKEESDWTEGEKKRIKACERGEIV